MADSRPTPASPWRALSLCFTAIVVPARMEAEELKDNEIRRRAMTEASSNKDRRVFVVRQAFFGSFLLVLLSGIAGYIAGVGIHSIGRCATPATVAWLQITGASLLLWGTLFIRGWEIQSHGGVTLTERVNQWIYRALYCVGTAVVVYSLAFATCKQ